MNKAEILKAKDEDLTPSQLKKKNEWLAKEEASKEEETSDASGSSIEEEEADKNAPEEKVCIDEIIAKTLSRNPVSSLVTTELVIAKSFMVKKDKVFRMDPSKIRAFNLLSHGEQVSGLKKDIQSIINSDVSEQAKYSLQRALVLMEIKS